MNFSPFELRSTVLFRKHSTAEYYFAYPDGGKFVEKSRQDKRRYLRLFYTQEDRTTIVTIERLTSQLPIAEIANKLLQSARAHPVNIPPQPVPGVSYTGLRLRRVFLEGGRDIRIIDTTLIQHSDQVYQIEYLAPPETFEAGLWVYETVINTFHFV